MKMLHKTLCFFLLLFGSLSAAPFESSVAAFHEGIRKTSYFENSKGQFLRYTLFETPAEASKGTVVFMQGRGTFLEFYEDLLVPLLARGFNVWMYDLSGQGGSTRLTDPAHFDEYTARKIQHIDTFDYYVEDLDEFVQQVVLPNADLNGVLLLGGYSTGAHAALRYLEDHVDHPFDAGFMISPLLGLKAPVPNKMMSYLFSGASYFVSLESYGPSAGNEDPIFDLDFNKNVYTSSRVGFNTMKLLCFQHRNLMMGGVSVGWLKAAVDSLNLLWTTERIAAVQIPVLIATGADDQLIDISVNRAFAEALPFGEYVEYPKGRHELFRETTEIRSLWWSDFDGFHKG
jgi:lysophospholipase